MFISFKNPTTTKTIISNINLTEPVERFLQNLSITTKIHDDIQIKKIMESIKNNTLQPSFFSLSENYYLQIPKTQK